jgi:hypothetical protein
VLVDLAFGLASAVAQLLLPLNKSDLPTTSDSTCDRTGLGQQRPISRHFARLTRRRGSHLARQLRSELDDLGLNRDLWLNDKLGSHAKFGSTSLDGMTALSIGGKGNKNESTVRTKLSTITGFAI